MPFCAIRSKYFLMAKKCIPIFIYTLFIFGDIYVAELFNDGKVRKHVGYMFISD